MDDFQNALEGKVTTEGWDAEKLVNYHKFLTDETAKGKSEVTGLREAKRAEADRVEKLKADALALEEAAKKPPESAPPAENPQMAQFRAEQVEKAKRKLFSSVKLTDEEKAVVLEKFSRLDTGKLDSDLIYEDLVSAVAAANAPKYLELTGRQDAAEAEAQAELARQAAAGNAPPAGQEPKKYSEDALDLAKKAGITPEEATKQVAQGMTRVYE